MTSILLVMMIFIMMSAVIHLTMSHFV